MKNMRIPLFIALGVAVIGIILGSFFDLSISTAIASPTNVFALTVSAIGPTIGFAAVAAMGGAFIAFAIKGEYHIGLRVLFYVLAAICLGVAIYFPGGEYFGINGFYKVAPEWLGYIIAIIPEAAAMVGGYFLFKDFKNKNMWIVCLIIVGLLLIALLALIPILKGILHRPRYRLISAVEQVSFHNWWQPCKNYKELMETYNIPSDNFKSYPSGHTGEAAILLVAATFFPMAHEKFKKYQLPFFIGSCVIVLLVALARILAAAHFLSDVSFGALIILVPLVIANEVVIRIKPLHLEEEAPVEVKE